jgi:hypothetical protein
MLDRVKVMITESLCREDIRREIRRTRRNLKSSNFEFEGV